MENKAFVIFQLMYLILNELNDEEKNDNLCTFLSDANPFMRKGENSADPVLFRDFKQQFERYQYFDDYSYDFINNYLKNISYYGKTPYDCFNKISKEDFVEACKNIIENNREVLKTI